MATLTSKDQLTTPSTSSDDDYLKRNTDCVYFLASPLTCKKGSECEYRHSEYARLNPRDCVYWMNGNCLNPKCAFRHPPLDGLVGTQAGSFTVPSVPGPPTLAAPVGPHNAVKQAVPCIFFQKGHCLKGDRCPFLHGPAPASAKVPQISANSPATQPPSVKLNFGGLEKFTQTKVNIQTNTSRKVVEKPVQINVAPKVETSLPRNGASSGRRGPAPGALIGESLKYEETIVPPIDNGRSRSRFAHAPRVSSLDDPNFQNGRDADDTLRESSPGFDVLVDDKLRDEEYYQNEDQFVRMRARDGRNLNEFEMNRYDDYDSVVDVDSDLYHNQRGYDSYDHMQERYAQEQRRASSERSPGEPTQYDRRGSYKSESPDFVQNSDLRQRLSKQRRVNDLKSVVNSGYNHEDRSYRANQRETRHSPTHESSRRRSPTHESSRSSRLQGRIKLPRRSSPVGGGNMYSERGHGSGRNWGRPSPTRPLAAGQQGRLRDRLRVNEDTNEGRTSQGFGMRRESFNENNNFAAPKSLAELKGSKQTDSKPKGHQSVSGGKLRDTVLASSVGLEGDLSFDGPKPLSEILKRKRDTGITVSTGDADSGNKENKQHQNNENPRSSNADSAADAKKQTSLDSEPEQAQATKVENKPVAAKGDKEDVKVSNKKMKQAEGEGSIPSLDQPDVEEGLNNVAQGKELGDEHEPEQEQEQEHEQVHDEQYDQGDGEYEYEQYDGEGYDLNEGETVENDVGLMDEDDGDDFAKKIGVSL